jgi:hypothetical protein
MFLRLEQCNLKSVLSATLTSNLVIAGTIEIVYGMPYHAFITINFSHSQWDIMAFAKSSKWSALFHVLF